MKIAQAQVNMGSTHKYYEENTVTVQSGIVTRNSFLKSLNEQEKKMDTLEISIGDATENKAMGSESYNSLKPSKTEYLGNTESSMEQQLADIRNSILQRILSLLQMLGGEDKSSYFRETVSNTANMLTSNSFLKVTTVEMKHLEEETTTFSGSGAAVTEDGRRIDFNVDFSMSRKLCQYAGITRASSARLVDPLVINVGNEVTTISDQHFYFDLDSDGKEEKISALNPGSGFLALDKNEDGKINDGSELFGTKSGDGFKDLGVYDKDHNGWIDENDEIYEALRIWIRDEEGVDHLMSLKAADVGAIYLGNVATEYTHQNSDLMVSGMMKASGLFLKESGGVGTVHQIDMAAL
ncbi:hypothetical protein SAMN04487928_1314 [Butyrivibrio proteoclasticus]|uniref:Uncharacterized protein n=1 Tax=Butyrivibrio proteoclasticus TaxID=43305 RepID=A0A1I5XDL4_9FIRM|nr:hypothetical protein [Butyrivibrio proteoclasticus]SFQ30063.1 hypothetical protein SAMN04487928_1314 [Butyrivibrio proteoclasticus]